MNETNDEAVQACSPDMKRSGPLKIGILAARDLRFAFWERRLFEKMASDSRFEISAIIVDGREPPPRKGIYTRLTNPHLPNAVIRRLTRMIDKAAMTHEPDVPAPIFEPRLAQAQHLQVWPHRNGHVDRFAAADVEQIRDLDLDILLRLGRALADGLQPEIEESLKAIEIVTNVRDTFELIRASDYAINDSQAEVRGCQVLRASKGGGKALRLHYMKRLPEVMVLSTVLVLNATASRMRCDLPFAIYDEFHSMDYQPDIKFFSIRARPHCEKAVCFVKIRNAPGARHHFDEHAWGYLSRSRC